jgi:hypothetical protein
VRNCRDLQLDWWFQNFPNLEHRALLQQWLLFDCPFYLEGCEKIMPLTMTAPSFSPSAAGDGRQFQPQQIQCELAGGEFEIGTVGDE